MLMLTRKIRWFLGCAVVLSACKSFNNIYTPEDKKEYNHFYLLIQEQEGRVYVQEQNLVFRQFKRLSDLEEMRGQPGMEENRSRRDAEIARSIKLSKDHETGEAYYDGGSIKFRRLSDPLLPVLFAQLSNGLIFKPIRQADPDQKQFLAQFRMQGPFLEAKRIKAGAVVCERFAYTIGIGGTYAPQGNDKGTPGFRANASRDSDLGECGKPLADGIKYPAHDSAFGGIFILDDDQKIVGILALAYMYSEFFIVDGYPPKKAMQFLKRHAGTAESVYE